MKRVIIAALLIGIAAIAGIVRSHSRLNYSVSHVASAASGPGDQTREEIRKSIELSPGARVEITGINGGVTIETSDNQTAEIYVERTADSREALARRRVLVDASASSLKIHGERGDVGFFAGWFGSNPSERVTLKVPRQISLSTKGINGAVSVGQVDGPVEVHGVNGKVDIAESNGSVELKGINGNIALSLKQLASEGVTIAGINGNIELRLNEGVNAELETHGMNGRVISSLADVVIDKERHGHFLAHIGTGGNPINAKGVNGNIVVTRAMLASSSDIKSKS